MIEFRLLSGVVHSDLTASLKGTKIILQIPYQ